MDKTKDTAKAKDTTKDSTSYLLLKASRTDTYHPTDTTDKLLARALLELLPDEFIRYGLYEVFGLGDKPLAKTRRRLNKWRNSKTAQCIYGLWRGTDYTPKPLYIPRKQPNLNGKVYRVYLPIIDTIPVNEAFSDCVDFGDVTIYKLNKHLPSPANKSKPIAKHRLPIKVNFKQVLGQPIPCNIEFPRRATKQVTEQAIKQVTE